MRIRLRIAPTFWPVTASLTKHQIVEHRLVARVGFDRLPLDAFWVVPAEPRGLLIYFVGFNVALDAREVVKCQLLAQATGCVVVTSELPGFSRYGVSLPKAVRQELLRGNSEALVELVLESVRIAATAAGVVGLAPVRLLGFSTGSTLAAQAARIITEVASVTLVEPVAIVGRNLAQVQLANTADFLRWPKVLRQNQMWATAVEIQRLRRKEPQVRYRLPDLIALATMLGSDITWQDAVSLTVPCSIVRGERSSLCPSSAFASLDTALDMCGISGVTATVPKLGHQLWHAMPTVAAIADKVL